MMTSTTAPHNPDLNQLLAERFGALLLAVFGASAALAIAVPRALSAGSIVQEPVSAGLALGLLFTIALFALAAAGVLNQVAVLRASHPDLGLPWQPATLVAVGSTTLIALNPGIGESVPLEVVAAGLAAVTVMPHLAARLGAWLEGNGRGLWLVHRARPRTTWPDGLIYLSLGTLLGARWVVSLLCKALSLSWRGALMVICRTVRAVRERRSFTCPHEGCGRAIDDPRLAVRRAETKVFLNTLPTLHAPLYALSDCGKILLPTWVPAGHLIRKGRAALAVPGCRMRCGEVSRSGLPAIRILVLVGSRRELSKCLQGAAAALGTSIDPAFAQTVRALEDSQNATSLDRPVTLGAPDLLLRLNTPMSDLHVEMRLRWWTGQPTWAGDYKALVLVPDPRRHGDLAGAIEFALEHMGMTDPNASWAPRLPLRPRNMAAQVFLPPRSRSQRVYDRNTTPPQVACINRGKVPRTVRGVKVKALSNLDQTTHFFEELLK